jgi:hypothetical protein
MLTAGVGAEIQRCRGQPLTGCMHTATVTATVNGQHGSPWSAD